MAFFGRKKVETQKGAQRTPQLGSASASRDLSSVLLRPRVTEKSSRQNDQGIYTFVVRRTATKYDVRDAIKLLFTVTPRKVTMVNRAPRTSHSRSRSRNVVVPGMKKANVFLRKGDRIDVA